MNAKNSRSATSPILKWCAIFTWFIATAQEPLEVLRISPETPASQHANIGIEFNQPMVHPDVTRFSDKDVIVTIDPPVDCDWRWAWDWVLLCELKPETSHDLATKFTVTVHAGARSVSGAVLSTDFEHQFSTEVVRVRDFDAEYPRFWKPRIPVFNVRFNQPVRKEDVEQNLRMRLLEDASLVSLQAAPRSPKYKKKQAWKSESHGWNPVNFDDYFNPSDIDWRSYSLREGFSYEELALTNWEVAAKEELGERVQFVLEASGIPSIFGSEKHSETQVSKEGITLFDREMRFIGVACKDAAGLGIVSTGAKKISRHSYAACSSEDEIELRFTNPVPMPEILDKVEVSAWIGEEYLATPIPSDAEAISKGRWIALSPNRSQLSKPWDWKPDTLYKLSLKEAAESSSPEPLKDKYGNMLVGDLALIFRTLPLSPQLEFVTDNKLKKAILESHTNTDLSIRSTNLGPTPIRYRLLHKRGAVTQGVFDFRPPALDDVVSVSPFPIRDLIGRGSAAFYAEATFKGIWRDHVRRLHAQVTPYHVHAKIGYFNSLVWVTDIQTARPVRGVRVELLAGKFSLEHTPIPTQIVARTNRDGIATLPGFRELGKESFHILKASGQQGMSLMPLSYDYRVNSKRVLVGREPFRNFDPTQVWGTTAQGGLYRSGDTVQYKIYLRNRDLLGPLPPHLGEYALSVYDPRGNVVHTERFKPNRFGSHDGKFALSATANPGDYRFVVAPALTEAQEITLETDPNWPKVPQWEPVYFRVTDFVPPNIQVSTEFDQESYSYRNGVVAKTLIQTQTGEPVKRPEATVEIWVKGGRDKPVNPVFEQFQFGFMGGRTKVLVRTSVANAHGSIATWADLGNPELPAYGTIYARSTVIDDRGREISSESGSALFIGKDRYIGIRVNNRKPFRERIAKVEAVVLDAYGNPMSDTEIQIQLKSKAEETSTLDENECTGTPTPTAPLTCTHNLGEVGWTGIVRIQAKCNDPELRCSEIDTQKVFAPKKHRSQLKWQPEQGKGLDASEVAEVDVGTRFSNHPILVTVERHGILDHWVIPRVKPDQTIKIPAKDIYYPGVEISFVSFMPRNVSEELKGTVHFLDKEDPNKSVSTTSSRLLEVDSRQYRYAVNVLTDRSMYRPGDQVEVSLAASADTAEGRKSPIEFTVIALDQSVLDLVQKGEDYFNPIEGFKRMQLGAFVNQRATGVEDYNLLNRVDKTGRVYYSHARRRHQTTRADLREEPNYVAYWNPSVLADQDGHASIRFQIPDQVTKWQVLALAADSSTRFGFGATSFDVEADIEIQPLLPNQVSRGDEFNASFIVANHNEHPRKISVSIAALGNATKEPVRHSQTVELGSKQRTTVAMPFVVDQEPVPNAGSPSHEIQFEIEAKDRVEESRLSHVVPITDDLELLSILAVGSAERETVAKNFTVPNEAANGGARLTLSVGPSVIDNQAKLIERIRDFPYRLRFRDVEMWLSRLLAAAAFDEFKGRWGVDWPLRNEFLQNALVVLKEFQTFNGAISRHRQGDPDHHLSSFTRLVLSVLEEREYPIRGPLVDKLDHFLWNFVSTKRSPVGNWGGDWNTVSPVGLHALARSRPDVLTPRILEKASDRVRSMNVFELANYLAAASRIRGTERTTNAIWQKLSKTFLRTEGEMQFGTEKQAADLYALQWYRLAKCAALSALVSAYQHGYYFARANDIEALIRGINDSMPIYFDNDFQGVGFCILAFSDYARAFETEPPNARFTARLHSGDDTLIELGSGEFTDFAEEPIEISARLPMDLAGKPSTLELVAEGQGRVHYSATMRHPIHGIAAKGLNARISVIREYSVLEGKRWRLLKNESQINRGDKVRVDLFLEVSRSHPLVVLVDPVPGGIEPANDRTGTLKRRRDSSEWEDYSPNSYIHTKSTLGKLPSEPPRLPEEVSDSRIVYRVSHLTKGRHHMQWVGRAVGTGKFRVPSSLAQQEHSPETFGTSTEFYLIVKDPHEDMARFNRLSPK